MAIDSISGKINNNYPNTKTTAQPSEKALASELKKPDKTDPSLIDKIKTVSTASAPPVNSENVERLKNAIADGSYKIDDATAQRVASNILKSDN